MLICRSVVEQPLKIPFVAAIVLAANPQKYDLTQDVIKRAEDAMQRYLENGSWREVKLVLRFLGCLQGLFEGDGVFTVLEELFSRAVDLQTASSEDVRIGGDPFWTDEADILHCRGWAWKSSRSSYSRCLM